MPNTSDFLIIGAGIVGLTVARELKLRYPTAAVRVIEKEAAAGRHSSGRNSGVLHSGIYYPPGSLRAEVCAAGAREMADYHTGHGLALARRGKVLVATSEDDVPQLDALLERGRLNGIDVEKVDARQLEELEPHARSAGGSALWVPSTAVGSPRAVMNCLLEELDAAGVQVDYNNCVREVDLSSGTLGLGSGDRVAVGHVVNTAGLHADRVAHMFGVGKRFTVLPFKGIYWKLDPTSGITLNRLIYPVPDLRVPFLGVHTTTGVDGSTYLGPTAVPAFGRENYRGLQGVRASELLHITGLLALQYLRGRDGFRRLAWQEGRRYFKRWFIEAARSIVPALRTEHLVPTDKVGIRPQLFDREQSRLVTDFLVETGKSSTHVLNAISPAWTSAFPFARYVCDKFIDRS